MLPNVRNSSEKKKRFERRETDPDEHLSGLRALNPPDHILNNLHAGDIALDEAVSYPDFLQHRPSQDKENQVASARQLLTNNKRR